MSRSTSQIGARYLTRSHPLRSYSSSRLPAEAPPKRTSHPLPKLPGIEEFIVDNHQYMVNNGNRNPFAMICK